MNTGSETIENARADARRWKECDRRADTLRGQFFMASVGIPEVTLDNWQDFAVRVQLLQAVNGVNPADRLSGARALAMVGTSNRWAPDLDDVDFAARVLRRGILAARRQIHADSRPNRGH